MKDTRDIKYLVSAAETLLEMPSPARVGSVDKDTRKLIEAATKLCLMKIIRELK